MSFIHSAESRGMAVSEYVDPFLPVINFNMVMRKTRPVGSNVVA